MRRAKSIWVALILLLAGANARASSHIIYHGGPVMGGPTIFPLYYGSGWTSTSINAQQSYLTNLTNYISGAQAPANQSPFIRQYGVEFASVASAVSVASAPRSLSDSDIRTAIHNAQGARQLPPYAANVLIMVFPDTSMTPNGNGNAYHSSESITAIYGVVFSSPSILGSWTLGEISSHEIFESLTDPSFASSSAAWQGPGTNNPPEICDDASCQPGSQTANIFTSNGIQILGCADNTQGGACTTTGFITNPSAPSCGQISSGQGLISNSPQNAIQSCDGTNLLGMFSGTLNLTYKGTVEWTSSTGAPAVVARMQSDGNFVIARGFPGDDASDTIWATNTFGQPGAYMAVQSDGNLVVYRSNGIPIWAYNYPATPTSCGRLNPGQGLAQGTTLSSCDGRFHVSMQLDGNLVLYFGPNVLWASNTSGWGNLVMAIMQSDGNFVIYNRANSPMTPLWSSNTHTAGNFLVLGNDGNMAVKNTSAGTVWSTNTCCH